jgi:hypothetical protein
MAAVQTIGTAPLTVRRDCGHERHGVWLGYPARERLSPECLCATTFARAPIAGGDWSTPRSTSSWRVADELTEQLAERAVVEAGLRAENARLTAALPVRRRLRRKINVGPTQDRLARRFPWSAGRRIRDSNS